MDSKGDDRKNELRRRLDCREIALSLGLRLGRFRGAAWQPAHCFNTAAHPAGDRHPSLSIGREGYRCFACGISGDVFSLVMALRRMDFPEALEWLSRQAGMASEPLRGGRATLASTAKGTGTVRPWITPTAAPPLVGSPLRFAPVADPLVPKASEAPRGPVADWSALWEAALPVTADVQARRWLESRGLEANATAQLDLARVLPPHLHSPVMRIAGLSWQESGHRLLLPLFDEQGSLAGLRGRQIRPDAPATLPKCAAPIGLSLAGRVLACSRGQALLKRGHWGEGGLGRLVVAEGEPDFLTWALRYSDADEEADAVWGIGSGSLSPALVDRIPAGSTVIARTDADSAGQHYALTLHRLLKGRCPLLRPRPEQAQGEPLLSAGPSPVHANPPDLLAPLP